MRRKNQRPKLVKRSFFKTIMYGCGFLILFIGAYLVLDNAYGDSKDPVAKSEKKSAKSPVIDAKVKAEGGDLKPKKNKNKSGTEENSVNENEQSNRNASVKDSNDKDSNGSGSVINTPINEPKPSTTTNSTSSPSKNSGNANSVQGTAQQTSNAANTLNIPAVESASSAKPQQTGNNKATQQNTNNVPKVTTTSQQAVNSAPKVTVTPQQTVNSAAANTPQQSSSTNLNASLNSSVSSAANTVRAQKVSNSNTVGTANDNSSTPQGQVQTRAQVQVQPPPAQTPAAAQTTQVAVQNPEFFTAIDSDNVDLITNLINKRVVDWKAKNSQGYNALHYAAMNLKINVLRYLLERVVPEDEVDIFSHNGLTALQLACSSDNTLAAEAANLLLNHRAGVNKTKTESTVEMKTPLFLAVENGNENLVKTLLDNGANANEVLQKSNESVLHYAMRSCKRKIIKDLIDKGADVNYVNGFNRLPIHESAAQGCVEGLRELILTRRISKNIKSPASSAGHCKQDKKLCLFKATPLHFAVKEQKIESVEFLLLIQAATDIKDEKRNTPEKYVKDEISTYFTDRKDWEKNRQEIQDVENLMRYCETLDPQDSLDYFYHLNRKHLHKNNNPVPKSEDNVEVPNLTDCELNFLKSNVSGMENITINSGTGNEILSTFFRLRRTNRVTPEINFVPGLNKNIMKKIEANHIVFKF